MQCPFPGMDPYLEGEDLWGDFHRQMVICIHETLQRLDERFYSTIGERRYGLDCPNGHHTRVELYIEMCEKSCNKPRVLLDLVGPANKTTRAGRIAYLARRQEGLAQGSSHVEIDLVLQGQPTWDYPRDKLPPWNYTVTMDRSVTPGRFGLFGATLQTRLPRILIPLFPKYADLVFDLQSAFTNAYSRGAFSERIDYSDEPPGPLSAEDREWLDSTLVAGGFRQPQPTHEQVAIAAYHIWEKEGRPHGRDRAHWTEALAQLQRIVR
jgi:hypothetical protein